MEMGFIETWFFKFFEQTVSLPEVGMGEGEMRLALGIKPQRAVVFSEQKGLQR